MPGLTASVKGAVTDEFDIEGSFNGRAGSWDMEASKIPEVVRRLGVVARKT